jgi:cell division protein FtsB
MEGGLNIQQQIQQLMSVVAYLLKKDAEREALKKENEELRKRIEKLEKELG